MLSQSVIVLRYKKGKLMNHVEKLQAGQAVELLPSYQIRLITKQDLSAVKQMLSDPLVTEYLFFAPAPDAVYEGYFNPMIDEIEKSAAQGVWANNLVFVITDDQQQFAGMIGLTKVDFLVGNYEIGYQFPQSSWRKGLATQACKLISQLAFEQLGAHKITADCYASNKGSYGVLLKSGYQQEGVSVDYYKTDRGMEDRLFLGLSSVTKAN